MGIRTVQPDPQEATTGKGKASRILVGAAAIAQRVGELGLQLTADFAGKDPIFVAVLQGAVVFFADLIRQVQLELVCDTISVSSYRGGGHPAGEPQLILQPREDWKGRHIIFVECIVDTGMTAKLLAQMAAERQAATVRLCTLLNKPSRRTEEVRCDYVGFTIEDHFVVGYGLDFRGRSRNLPHIEVVST